MLDILCFDCVFLDCTHIALSFGHIVLNYYQEGGRNAQFKMVQ